MVLDARELVVVAEYSHIPATVAASNYNLVVGLLHVEVAEYIQVGFECKAAAVGMAVVNYYFRMT